MSSQVKVIKIVYLITDLTIGGAQKVLVHILKHMDRRRFAPTVACFYGGEGSIADELRTQNVSVIDLNMNAKWRIDAFWKLFHLLRQEKPSILHSSLFHANIPGRLLGRLAGVPIIVSWRQNISIGGYTRELINRWTAPLDDCVVAVSTLTREAEIKQSNVSPEKVITIYNGIDIDLYTTKNTTTASQIRRSFGIPDDVLLIGTVGRLHPQKGIASLLNAMPLIIQQVPNVRWLVVGDGELRSELEAQTRLLDLSNVVIFTGVRTDVPDILSALDLFVLPSLWEGLPLALLEAMAAGSSVVATAVGGIPEVIIDGNTGVLVPPQKPDALSKAIVRILKDSDLRSHMGQAGRRRVEHHFSIQKTVKEIEQIYNKLLAEKGPR